MLCRKIRNLRASLLVSDVEYVVRLLYQLCAHIFAPDKILQNLEQGDSSVFLLCFFQEVRSLLLLGPKESLTRFPMNNRVLDPSLPRTSNRGLRLPV